MTRFNIDKKEYDAWVKNLNYAYKNFDESFLRQFLVEMVARVIAKTKVRTPVQTGNLRRRWATGEFVKQGNVLGLEIINDAYHDKPEVYGKEYTGYYASFIEYGFRLKSGKWYEGRFMLAISIEEVRAQMPRRFNAAFNTWVKNREI